MTENKPQQHTSAGGAATPPELAYPAGQQTTTLTPAQADPEAEKLVQAELNARVAKAPVSGNFVKPDLPPGLSPNQILGVVTGHGEQAVEYKPKLASSGTAASQATGGFGKHDSQ